LLAEGAYYLNTSTSDDNRANTIPGLEKMTQRSYSLILRYTISDNLTLGTRMYFKRAGPEISKGVLMLQDINYRFRRIPLTLWLRYCLFSTDDWNSRLYVYENDLLYSYSIPALYGRGSKNYILASWKMTDKSEIRIKYGILSKEPFTDQKPFSEEFRFQIRIFI
jgi:hypothetical protein